ncbi:hypothetical protein J4573_48090 [Actinomadura barringtoniae]|uniref:Abortive infection protein n=1 Tax=Actinomadura barringtoniae TaxID=1427535 RepID=A0A939PLP6_9ACTN|nr:hypothetical protein [Actinomadura barringtoniae]MBO2454920.1 hypothetical protein [Actinomadura barringtoniae]
MTIERRTVLVGAAALTAAYATPVQASTRIPLRGMNYDTEREVWLTPYVRHDIKAIRHQLHCTGILLLGSDLHRLTEAAEIATAEGLKVWFEPRQFDKGARETLAFIKAVGHVAERLKAGLSLGCELTIFMDGLVPGKNYIERAQALATTPDYNQRLNNFLATALTTVRSIFHGPITYSSGVWEDVAWQGFDMVGIDLYRDSSNEKTYASDVRALHRHRKPVIITEFGCCTYRGADKRGGDGFDIIDWTKNPPVIKGHHVRDERVQARYIDECLTVHERQGVHGTFVYNFIETESPYMRNPKLDMDMAGFSVVKVFPDYARTGRWAPKLSFHTITQHFK